MRRSIELPRAGFVAEIIISASGQSRSRCILFLLVPHFLRLFISCLYFL